MAKKQKQDKEDELEDTKSKKLDPKAWEGAEEEPEEEIAEAGKGDPAEQTEGTDPVEDEVVVIPEPPRDSKPRGARDAIWVCKTNHETRGFENRKPECRFSNCPTPNDIRIKIVYEEKQRRAKDPKLSA